MELIKNRFTALFRASSPGTKLVLAIFASSSGKGEDSFSCAHTRHQASAPAQMSTKKKCQFYLSKMPLVQSDHTAFVQTDFNLVIGQILESPCTFRFSTHSSQPPLLSSLWNRSTCTLIKFLSSGRTSQTLMNAKHTRQWSIKLRVF